MSGSSVLLCSGILIAASLVVGRAVLVVCGRREWSWLTPAVGLAALLAIAGTSARLPGDGAPMLALTGALVVASATVLARNERLSALRGPARIGLPIALIALLAACLPFAFNGRFGILGPRVLPDLVEHLFIGEWLLTHDGPEPNKMAEGYPLGPHAIAIAVGAVARAPLDAAFTALLIVIPMLTAMTALSAAGELPPLRRAAAAVLTGLASLSVAYILQSSFKEPLMALLLLAFALGLRELSRHGTSGRLRAVPLAVLAFGAIQVYSFPALIWLVGILLLWVGSQAWLHEGRFPPVRRYLRPALPYLLLGTGVLAIGLALQSHTVFRFLNSSIAAGALCGGACYDFRGNLDHPLAFWEALGVWPSPDYRFPPAGAAVEMLSAAVGMAAVAYGVWWWTRQRDPALPVALAVCLGVWLCSQPLSVTFTSAKALPIAAPLAVLTAAGALLAKPQAHEARLVRVARSGLALAFIAGTAWSSFLVLQGSQVAAGAEARELAQFRPLVKGHTVLSLARDVNTPHYLRGAIVGSVGGLAELYVRPRFDRKPVRFHQPGDPVVAEGDLLDFDTVDAGILDRVDFVVTTRTDYQSAPPSNFRRVASTRSLVLWQRHGVTPPRQTLSEPGAPGRILSCPGGQRPPTGRAGIFQPPPVDRDAGAWLPIPGTGDDGPPDLRQRLRLPPGRWQISVQYSSQDGLILKAPGLLARLPATLDYVGGFWPVGTVRSSGAPFTVIAQPSRRPFLARLLGRRLADATPEFIAGEIAAVRAGSRAIVPLQGACGRYVDWFRLRQGH